MTRPMIRETALRMFTERGFDGTSMKDLADELGVTKSSLYYHFAGKDAIVLSLLEHRQQEIEALLAWVQAEPPSLELAGRAALRWLDSMTPEAMQGMRFARANQPAMRRLSDPSATSPFGFARIIDTLIPEGASDSDRLRVRLLFETGASAIFVADGLDVSDTEILDAARDAVQRLAATDTLPFESN